VYRSVLEALDSAPLRCPPELIGGVAELSSLFEAINREQQLPVQHAQRIAKLVPESIRVLPCFLDRLTGIWRYDYGEPIEVGDRKVIGTHMFNEVKLLFEIVSCAAWRLPPHKLDAYLARLIDRVHHQDVLVEFAPILRLSSETAVEHEVSGFGGGNSTVDWNIQATDQPRLLLEIKHRIGDLIESFKTFDAQGPDQSVPAPQHDHALLFRSIERKFKLCPADETIQAAWIMAGLK
jgi:hypothetical protein